MRVSRRLSSGGRTPDEYFGETKELKYVGYSYNAMLNNDAQRV